MYTHSCLYTHMHIQVPMGTCTRICMYTHSCMYTHMHIQVHVYACIHTFMHVHTYIYTYTQAHTCTCVYIPHPCILRGGWVGLASPLSPAQPPGTSLANYGREKSLCFLHPFLPQVIFPPRFLTLPPRSSLFEPTEAGKHLCGPPSTATLSFMEHLG